MRSAIIIPLVASLASASPLGTRGIADSYDYIIVGGGAGGLVVANRLSETNATVLVIEAGGSEYYNPNVTRTDGYGLALATDLDWQYNSVKQVYANDTTMLLHAGKALGGSTTINGMSFTRAQDTQIDHWEKVGNPGWNWANLWSYYLKSEKYQIPGKSQIEGGAAYNSSYHGYDGKLQVGYPQTQLLGDILEPLNETYQALGVPYSDDVSGGKMRGFNVFPMMINVDEDVRSDAARAYYYPYSSRANLDVAFHTTVSRVIWGEDDSEGNAVVSGVEAVLTSGEKRTFKVNKEVILSTGALRTPSILELSGVGNPKILSKANVTTKVDLPGVGENLMDQINNGIYYEIKNNKTYTGLPNWVSYPNVTDIFGAEKASELATSVKDALPALATKIAAQNNNATNATTLLELMELQYDLLFEQQVPIAEILHQPSTALESEYWGTLPFARGNAHIKSSDPNVPAEINPNYFMFDFDLDVQVGVAQFYRKLFATAPLSEYAGSETKPGFSIVPEGASDAAWGHWLKTNWRPNFHVISTAIMMPKEKGGVVSDRLKVYGTSNLRVVDASVVPFQVCGHLTSTLYALAERASDLIKEDGGY
ncbi:GMC oxidoreductase [Saccharata proteae CBS 121410]|uniref:GMC oxidoreductase n=1 Tax=Saccharata proteae CBS 121410 TaxID=1314787 RepID=A0A9P4HQ45_9PEZI|nr:GMC oxidoreductase [Saccharata proteae CBS 121410]